jgi:hypothetical protein
MKDLNKIFEEIGSELVKELTKNLLQLDKKATGDLIRSLDYKVVEKVDGFLVTLLADEHLKWVDEGRRPGKQPPTKALDRWVVARGITMKDKKGKFIKRESVKFLIARAIGKKGIKPTNVIQKTIDNVWTRKKELIRKAAIEDINALIDKIII